MRDVAVIVLGTLVFTCVCVGGRAGRRARRSVDGRRPERLRDHVRPSRDGVGALTNREKVGDAWRSIIAYLHSRRSYGDAFYWHGEAGVTAGIVRLRVLSCEVEARDAWMTIEKPWFVA